MGTRGFIGFVAGGTEKLAYNHWDSYPSGLGMTMLKWLRGEAAKLPDGFAWIRERARVLRTVDPDFDPTGVDVEQLNEFYDSNVGGASDRPTWYQLLRGTQGEPGAMLRAGVIEDASGFPLDSLFAEWGYVVDLDADTFEVYQGFQHNAHDKGRFAGREGVRDGYAPCALVASWPLSALPSDDEFMAAVEPEESE